MIRNKKQNREIVIDLTGPDGNAFVLIGIANDIAKKLEWDPKKRGELNAELMSGDYENLLQVFDKHFGKFVILER
jgi:hypothetical protein